MPVIISSTLDASRKEKLVKMLREHKWAIPWSISDMKGINLPFYMHKGLMEDNIKPRVQPQRRLNPNMLEVVKKEVKKLLDAGIIYPMLDSPWVSRVQVVPKKDVITVVSNEHNEMIPTSTVIKCHDCIDYRKLNDATHKNHFPFPFIDQILK